MSGLHECPHCHYRFEDAESLKSHLEEGGGCPEQAADEVKFKYDPDFSRPLMFRPTQSGLEPGLVTVLRHLTADEADLEIVGPMYKVRYVAGGNADAFEDELSDPDEALATRNEGPF